MPIPEEPPCTSRTSPACRRPRSKTFVHTVKTVSGRAAASARSRPPGMGRHCTAGATQYSAYPPPATRAVTAVACGPLGRARPCLGHRARHFETGDVGSSGWRRVVARALQEVGTVHARGLDLDEDFRRTRAWHGAPHRAEHVGRSGGGDLDRRHVGGYHCFVGPSSDSIVAVAGGRFAWSRFATAPPARERGGRCPARASGGRRRSIPGGRARQRAADSPRRPPGLRASGVVAVEVAAQPDVVAPATRRACSTWSATTAEGTFGAGFFAIPVAARCEPSPGDR